MIKNIKQERSEKQQSPQDYDQNRTNIRNENTQKMIENSELQALTKIYNLQYQKIMEQIKQIYSEQSTINNQNKPEQDKLKKDKINRKIVCKIEKQKLKQQLINQSKNKSKEEQEQQLNTVSLQFSQIATNFLNNLREEFEKAEKELVILFKN